VLNKVYTVRTLLLSSSGMTTMILLSATHRHKEHCFCTCQPRAPETTGPGSKFSVVCACLSGLTPSYTFL